MDFILFLILAIFCSLVIYTYSRVVWWIIGYITKEYKKHEDRENNS